MNDDWSMEDGQLSSDEVDSGPEEDVIDHLDTYEINTGIISDTFRHLRRKAEQASKSNRQGDYPPAGIDNTVKRFLLNNSSTVDYRDLAVLTGFPEQDVKAALVQMGVNVPQKTAKRWADITFRNPESPEDCAKCNVQARHSTFYAGIYECRQCFAENIEYWIAEAEAINIQFKDRM